MTAPVPKSDLSCFVIMPFSDTTHGKGRAKVTIDAKQWKHIYEEWILKAVKMFPETVTCKRSAATPGNFVKGIIQDIERSDLVIADLTGAKPNVYYELGIRHALRTGTIIITQDISALPSDLRSYYCFEYKYSDRAHLYEESFSAFKSELHEKMRHVIDGRFSSDNPVSDFVGYSRYSKTLQYERARETIIRLLCFLVSECQISNDYLVDVEKSIPKNKTELLPRVLSFGVDHEMIQAARIELTLNINWLGIPGDLITRATVCLTKIRGFCVAMELLRERLGKTEMDQKKTIEAITKLRSMLPTGELAQVVLEINKIPKPSFPKDKSNPPKAKA
jgi:hypothetical protein